MLSELTLSEMHILVVDDEELNLEIIKEILASLGCPITTAVDGETAWSILEQDPHRFDLVLLDRVMPGIDGLEVLKCIKQHAVMQDIPVILQTAKTEPEDIAEGIREGAYYYLAKPFEPTALEHIVQTALEDRRVKQELGKELMRQNRSFQLLRNALFEFRTLDDTRDLSTMIANTCPDPNRVVTGLFELMINAVEHGNLGITYQEKTALRQTNKLLDEIEHRLSLPEYTNRLATVEYRRNNAHLEFHITDQGDGFDWQEYMDFNPKRMFDSHGRGIAMANKLIFDHLEYAGNGNEVTASIHL